MLGPAPPLNDPLFLQIVTDEELRTVITNGRLVTPAVVSDGQIVISAQKSAMPAFGIGKGAGKEETHGGARQKSPLTEDQIDILVEGIKKRWGQRPKSSGAATPPYRDDKISGDAKAGEDVFAMYCANCHGKDGVGGADAGALNDKAFLELTSDQALRRIVITGRPDLGMPDYRTPGDRGEPFQPMTSQNVADVVALLASWRKMRSDGK
jgi:mono/diheme cytochrome c family protein